MMKIIYDPLADVVDIQLRDVERFSHGEIDNERGVAIHYGEDGKIAAIEIHDASERVDNPNIISFSVDIYEDEEVVARQ